MTSRLVAGLTLSVALLLPPAAPAQTREVPKDSVALQHIVDIVAREYWRPLPADSIARALRAGGLAALDPYSVLLSRAEWAGLNTELQASFGGIGARFGQDSVTGQLTCQGTFVGSPAQAAGLRPGDALLSIDGVSTAGLSFDQWLSALRGPVGTDVALEIQRAGTTGARRVVVRRAVIHVPSVRGAQRAPSAPWDYRLGTDGVAYVRIMSFTETVPAELDSALAAVGRSGARALIIDLRDNGGGLTTAATQAADRFLDSGVVVTFHGRQLPDEIRRAEAGVRSRLPLAILVNGGTASAAELFTAALQDHHRAVVVGSRSYGKGMVQRLFALPDSSGALKLTVVAYLRPSGRTLDRHAAGLDTATGGIWPDSGMSVAETAERAAAAGAIRQEGDDMGAVAESRVPPPSPNTDAVLARAVAALRNRRTHH